jgi:hypothetical protein
LTLFLKPNLVKSQRDTIFRFDNRKIACEIIQKNLFNIKYKTSPNSLIYDMSTLNINKIKFRDGRLKFYVNLEKYAQSERELFINNCKRGLMANKDAQSYCNCIISKIEGTYSYNELNHLKESDEAFLGMLLNATGQCMAEIERKNGKSTEFNCSNQDYYANILPLKIINQNRMCPREIDEITRLEKLDVDKAKGSIIYYYTITSVSRNENNLESLRKSVESFLKQNNNLKNDKSLDDIRSRNVKLVNSYFDKNNIHLFDVEIDY